MSSMQLKAQTSDVQNMFIKERLAKANLAVNTLAALGLTVLSVCVETSQPLIRIQPSRACNQLKSAVSKIRNHGGRRCEESVATVADCQVRWEEQK